MAVSTFYGSAADGMHTGTLTSLHGEAARGLPASQINDTTTFIDPSGASAKIWSGNVGAMAVSTFYGSAADGMHTGTLTSLHGEADSVSGLACFSNRRYNNFHRSVGGVGQNMERKRRGYGRVYLLRKRCGRYAYGHVNESTWGSG
ncbi:hypothetical protein GN958_ATG03551 [Phytophthora infestans]|uniref:Uncharacterized protein n=1 Tax=Phytophthora infestans TaxID=4787 RepID=A0A8S9V7U6_PHYIN|nr:hypothetical protein GN958_ATG03551 [Phytophthora infestans]